MKKANLPIVDGQITNCKDCSHICHYRCCDQASADGPDFGQENSILLYPGELESASAETRQHLLVTMENFNGGKLARCDRENFDQSSCNPSNNFKPLDCESYPFAPVIQNNELKLVIDSGRCPLPVEQLTQHARYILSRWQKVLDSNPEIANWISSLELPNYISYELPTKN